MSLDEGEMSVDFSNQPIFAARELYLLITEKCVKLRDNGAFLERMHRGRETMKLSVKTIKGANMRMCVCVKSRYEK